MMVGLSQLWLPMLVSAVIVFLASSLLHMMIPWHKSDYKRVPNEDRARDAIRALAIPPGDYMMPCPGNMEEMRSEAFKKKFKDGPVLMMTVMPGGNMAMGGQLTMWFIYCLVVSLFAAYISGRALPPGTVYLQVFRFAGCTAFIGYSLALWQASIWYRRAWTTTIKSTIDGLIYGMLTAGVFGWLWPR